jgi:YcxB-like protein
MRSITFTPTEADLISAHRTQQRVSLFSRQAANIFGTIWLLLAIIMIVGASSGGPAAMAAAFGWSFVESVFLYVLLMVLSYLGIARISRRTFAQQKSLQDEYTVSWTGEAMDIHTTNARLHHPWSDFIRWAESDTTIMVYQSDRLMNFIPKTAFGVGDLNDFKACLIGAAIPKARMF